MQTINGSAITLTRGDTLKATVALALEGEPYEPLSTDVIRFALGIGYVGTMGYQLLYTQEIDHQTMEIIVPADETEKLNYRRYNWDIEITHGDGTVDTVMLGTLTITGEVE